MASNYHIGELVFYHAYANEPTRTLAYVHYIYYDKNELDIYYLDSNYDMQKVRVNTGKIRKAIRGRDTIDVINNEDLNNEERLKQKLINLADVNINEFEKVYGGSRKSKRRKSRHHKKTNRRRKSNRRKRSKLNIKSKH
jgi:hypothetical protein